MTLDEMLEDFNRSALYEELVVHRDSSFILMFKDNNGKVKNWVHVSADKEKEAEELARYVLEHYHCDFNRTGLRFCSLRKVTGEQGDVKYVLSMTNGIEKYCSESGPYKVQNCCSLADVEKVRQAYMQYSYEFMARTKHELPTRPELAGTLEHFDKLSIDEMLESFNKRTGKNVKSDGLVYKRDLQLFYGFEDNGEHFSIVGISEYTVKELLQKLFEKYDKEKIAGVSLASLLCCGESK